MKIIRSFDALGEVLKIHKQIKAGVKPDLDVAVEVWELVEVFPVICLKNPRNKLKSYSFHRHFEWIEANLTKASLKALNERLASLGLSENSLRVEKGKVAIYKPVQHPLTEFFTTEFVKGEIVYFNENNGMGLIKLENNENVFLYGESIGGDMWGRNTDCRFASGTEVLLTLVEDVERIHSDFFMGQKFRAMSVKLPSGEMPIREQKA